MHHATRVTTSLHTMSGDGSITLKVPRTHTHTHTILQESGCKGPMRVWRARVWVPSAPQGPSGIPGHQGQGPLTVTAPPAGGEARGAQGRPQWTTAMRAIKLCRAPLPAAAPGFRHSSGLGSGPTCLQVPIGMTPWPLPFGNSASGRHTHTHTQAHKSTHKHTKLQHGARSGVCRFQKFQGHRRQNFFSSNKLHFAQTLLQCFAQCSSNICLS